MGFRLIKRFRIFHIMIRRLLSFLNSSNFHIDLDVAIFRDSYNIQLVMFREFVDPVFANQIKLQFRIQYHVLSFRNCVDVDPSRIHRVTSEYP